MASARSRSSARLRVAVLFGGMSSEHAISCMSAGSVLRALDPERYEVIPVGITRAGRWVLPPEGQRLALDGAVLPEVTEGTSLVLPADPTAGGLRVLDAVSGVRVLGEVDVVFPVLHGPFGEDGTVQGLLEMAGLPYVGSGVFASAAAMDKAHMKAMLRAAGLPVGEYATLAPGRDLSVGDRERLALPVFVKPARGGSSVGITRVREWSQLEAAVAIAREHDAKVVVEEGIAGREVECGVLERPGAGAPEASAPAEVRLAPGYEFYDFEAKYLTDATSFDVPADLPPAVTAEVQRLAVAAFEALDCAGLARVDFFVRPDAGGAGGAGGAGNSVVLNEVNTMPGFTPVSMFPRMWAASGVAYPALVERLVQLALERAGRC